MMNEVSYIFPANFPLSIYRSKSQPEADPILLWSSCIDWYYCYQWSSYLVNTGNCIVMPVFILCVACLHPYFYE